MYRFHSLALLGSIFLLHLATLSYGQTPDEENDTGPTRKRPILRKIIILVGLVIGFAALCWALHKSYKAYRRWSQKRRRLVGRKEFDAMMEDLEKQEMNSDMSVQKEGQGSDPADSANGKYMPLNNTSPEEEPLMTSAEGSPERASQHVSDSDSKTKESGDASMPLLYNVPLDDSDPSGDQKSNMTKQGGGHSIEPSAPPDEERETQA